MTVSELKSIIPHIPLILCFPCTENTWTLAHDEHFGPIPNKLLDFKVLRLGAIVNSEVIQVYIDYPTTHNINDEFNDYHIALNG